MLNYRNIIDTPNCGIGAILTQFAVCFKKRQIKQNLVHSGECARLRGWMVIIEKRVFHQSQSLISEN